MGVCALYLANRLCRAVERIADALDQQADGATTGASAGV